MKEAALIIFQKKPERGKVKTRLAKTIGDQKAVEVYQYLLDHTHRQIALLDVAVYIFFDKNIEPGFLLRSNYQGMVQVEGSLGDKMRAAFQDVFQRGYQKAVIIGTDCMDLNTEVIKEAFCFLSSSDVVMGPAKDGGYYLLGMNCLYENLFENKEWSTSTVFADTMADIERLGLSLHLLKKLSDVDVYEDLGQGIKATLGIK